MGALIWLASYPKSGNTWVRSFLANLLRDQAEPADINVLSAISPSDSSRSWYEPYATKPLEQLSEFELANLRPAGHKRISRIRPDPIVVKTHNFLGAWHGVPLHTGEVTAGAIYVVRNPLDVAVSLRHYFGSDSCDDTIAFMAKTTAGGNLSADHVPEFYRTWSEHVASWIGQKRPQLHLVKYEDLLADPVSQFGRLTKFLGIGARPEQIERAVTFSSFENLKTQEREKGFNETPEQTDTFFREGRANQWRTELTPEQIRRVLADHGTQMERFGYVPEGF